VRFLRLDLRLFLRDLDLDLVRNLPRVLLLVLFFRCLLLPPAVEVLVEVLEASGSIINQYLTKGPPTAKLITSPLGSVITS